MRKLLLLWLALSPVGKAAVQFNFDPAQQRWDLDNSVVSAAFRLSPSGTFKLVQAGLPSQPWLPPTIQPSSPISFTLNDQVFDGNTQYTLIDHYTETTTRGGSRQVIVLQDAQNLVQVRVLLDLFTGQPVLRMRLLITNLSGGDAFLNSLDMLPLQFSDTAAPFRAFRVNQWGVGKQTLDFQTTQSTLAAAAPAFTVQSGALGAQVSWLAIRDPNNRGIFAGWEFNGRSNAWTRQTPGTLSFSAPIDSFHHPMAAGGQFLTPAAFLGFFTGDWDEAGYRTQRFVEAALARPAPDLQRFPYMSWDSWGFQEQFDEATLRREADLAAGLGVELFIVDLGWAKQLGNWYADPAKFPSGLKAFSDHVHALGMRFGVHFTPAEASPDSPILQANPDWTSTETDGYYNAVSLCLSHKPVQDWVVNQVLHLIDDYNVDWILQDGQNMVKGCTKTTHTHDPADSNYANSVEGIDAVVESVLKQRPNVSWENCENGGNMMTFKMVQDYVTSITNDASGALGSRQGAFGATYPFPPRYADRYSPEDPTTPYNTQSYMFGGPWHLMDQLGSLTPDQLSFAAWEIAAYKKNRGTINNGKVYHLTAAPEPGRIDALESSYLGNTLVTIVTREGGTADTYLLKPRGTSAQASYTVSFQNDSRVLSMTGQQLASSGVLVNLPNAQSSEIVYAIRKQ